MSNRQPGTGLLRTNHYARSGVAMFSAIFVMIVIGLLAVQFHHMTRQAQSTAFRFQASEIARQLAESAMDEAFLYIYNQSEKSSGEFFTKLRDRSGSIDCSTTSLDNLSGKGVDVKIDLTKAEAATILNGNKFDISAKARIIDFRSADPDGRKYYDKEGVGTLELKVSVTPKTAFKKQIKSACHLTRHHDYKVVSIVTRRNNSGQRSEYVHNYVLDYALFIRNGQREFDTTLGLSLNPEKQQFVVDQTGLTNSNCGKIYLGNRTGKYVFLNIEPARKDFLPAPVEKKKIVQASSDEVFKLLPSFYSTVKSEVKKKVKDEGASLKSFSMDGHKAFFEYSRYPITNDALTVKKNLQDFRDATLAGEAKAANKKALLDFFPGVEFKPDTLLSATLEGDIRQRFFHFGYFYVDLSSAYIKIKAEKHGKSKKFTINFPAATVNEMKNELYPCFDYDHFKDVTGFKSTLDLEYLKQKFAQARPELLCDIHEKNRFLKGSNNPLPTPLFYHYQSPSSSEDPLGGSIPFAHVNLWTRRELTMELAEQFGIYDSTANKLKLRGIIQFKEAITLGQTGSTLTVEGQGIIIAPGITIKSGITKADGNAICVLATRGQVITVDTDQLIEASLVSIDLGGTHTGYVKATKKLNLKGALAVDMLRLDKWAPGVKHTLRYDPALKPAQDLYQINLARWVSFQRMVEQDE
jgi:hypothetical protein